MKPMGFRTVGALFLLAGVVVGVVGVAKRKRFHLKDMPELRGGAQPRYLQEPGLLDECPPHPEPEDGIPTEFDARQKWKECPSLWEIRDQGKCLSCWAVAVASTLTDRYCIASGGNNFRFSDQELLGCSLHYTGWTSTLCSGKGEHRVCAPHPLEGCGGGSVELAWKYLTDVSKGLVSGGPHNSVQGCVSYEISPCDHTSKSCRIKVAEKISCVESCQDTYNRTYEQDKQLLSSVCQFNYPDSDNVTLYNDFIKSVQLEIMNNGPLVAVMMLYKSFDKFDPQNETIVYVAPDEKFGNDYHAVKIIGWGTSAEGKDYWLVANSYNYYWGYRGFFKIFRGIDRNDSARINRQISVGFPKV